MSTRTIGGDVRWDEARWSGAAPNPPYEAHIPLGLGDAERVAILTATPAATDGLPLSFATPHLRFVLQALDPTAGGVSQWDVSEWDVDVWSSSLGNWRDITHRVRGISWGIGAETPGDVPAVGVATLTLDNQDGEAAPWATSGEFTGPLSRSWLRAGRLMRWGVYDTDADEWHPFFTGQVESIDDDTESNVDAWTELTVAEFTTRLAREIEPVRVYAGRTLPAAIAEVLAAAGWDWQDKITVPADDALTGDALIAPEGSAEIAEPQTMSALAALQRVGDCRFWAVLCSPQGAVQFVDRDDPSVSLDVTLSNRPEGDELPMVVAKPYSSNERVLNHASAYRYGGERKAFTHFGSVQTYGFLNNRYGSPWAELPLASDDDVLALVQAVVRKYAFDDLGIATVELDADQDYEALAPFLAQLASMRYPSVTVKYEHPSGAVFERAHVVERQDHGLTKEGGQVKWVATLGLGAVDSGGGT